MKNFELVIQQFRNEELDIANWNFCCHKENNKYSAYIMGEGSEQCLTYKKGFSTKEEVLNLFKSLGVTKILPGV